MYLFVILKNYIQYIIWIFALCKHDLLQYSFNLYFERFFYELDKVTYRFIIIYFKENAIFSVINN